jgi:hypothetical protein
VFFKNTQSFLPCLSRMNISTVGEMRGSEFQNLVFGV